MMNKIFAKTVKKSCAFILLAATVVLLAAAIIVSALCGVNYGAGLEDTTTVSVTVNSFVYKNEREYLEETCESVFAAQGVEANYVYRSEMSGDECELAYVFDADTEETKLQAVKVALAAKLAAESANSESELNGAIVNVSASSETVKSKIAAARLWRAAIAVAVFAVLAFAYVAIRHGLALAFAALLAPIVSTALSTAVVLLTRIPVTSATFYAILVTTILSGVFTMMFLNKLSGNAKADAFAGADADTLVKGSLSSCWIGWTAIAFGVALVLLGAIATTAVRYFAIASFVGVVMAAFVGLIFAPNCALEIRTYLDKKSANKTASGYVGAKKADQE
ncbi:MAG: hypothetical protein E7355_03765 [Clostridiales bacterium]|nr:hypothetical protein [Clostridiales bacterium]